MLVVSEVDNLIKPTSYFFCFNQEIEIHIRPISRYYSIRGYQLPVGLLRKTRYIYGIKVYISSLDQKTKP
jgi:hypothetical protein